MAVDLLQLVFYLVLISTYWNVNSFNKLIPKLQDVLISTYWNVNNDWTMKRKTIAEF